MIDRVPGPVHATLASTAPVAEPPGSLSPFALAAGGFVELAAWWIREIGGHARDVAARVDVAGYSLDLAIHDIAKSVALVAAGLFRVVNEFTDAAVVMARPPEANIAEASARLQPPFDVPCTLRLEGPLRSRFDPPHLIPPERVRLYPRELPAGRTEFTVRIDASRL